MPITGTFEADFSQFATATQGAVQDLLAVQQSATSTTNAVTQLEKATSTHAGSVGTLRSAYQSFDGVLSAVGVHIGPQITALEELTAAAGKSFSALGLVGSAGLVVGTAMAAWDTGRWIAKVTGADQAIVNLTDSLLGTGLAAQTAGAEQDAIALALERTGIKAKNGAEALKLNTQWAKDNGVQAKFNAESAKAAAAEHDKWEAAVERVTAAGKGYQEILKGIDATTVATAKSELQHGAVLADVATAHKLTETQARALEQALKAEQKATDDAAAAEQRYNAQVMMSYNAQIKVIGDLEKARQQHFGLDGQIEQLQQLAAAEQVVTDAVLKELTNEQDRMKVTEANYKRQVEIEIDIGKIREQQTDVMAKSILRTINLQTELNKAYGLDAKGAILLPQDALMELNKKIDTINNTMQDGAEKTLALTKANKDYTDGLLTNAQAADTSTAATQANTAAKMSNAAASSTAAVAAGGTSTYPGGAGIAGYAGMGQFTGSDKYGNAYPKPGEAGYGNPIPISSATYPGGATNTVAGGAGSGGVMAGGGGAGAAMYFKAQQGYMTDDEYWNSLHGGLTGGLSGAEILRRIASNQFYFGQRAAGGPVSAGSAYVVGERGPEIFSPASSGTILPNVGGARGIQIVINGSVLSTQAELAAMVEAAMVAAYRRGGNRLPV